MHGIVLYCLCIIILYKSITIKNESKIMRNLTKSCIQNYKFVRVLDKYMYAAVLLGLKESNLPKTSLIIISSTILPSVPRATCQLPKFWHAQKAKFQDSNYLIDLKLTLPLCFLFCPLLSIFLPSPPPPPSYLSLHLFLFLSIWLPLVGKVLQKLLGS